MTTPKQPDATERRDDTGISLLTFRMILLMNLMTKPFDAIHGKEHDISLPEWRCVVWLTANPGSSGQETANGIGLDRMSVSRNLRTLEAKGRVSRRTDELDKKRWQWRLTDSGWDVYDTLFPAAQSRDHEITSTLTKDERAIVLKFLKNAAQTLKDVDRR